MSKNLLFKFWIEKCIVCIIIVFFHSGKHKLENTDCQTKVKNPQSQEKDVTMGHHYGMSDDEYIQGIIKAEVEKQLKELLKDKTSPRKSESDESQFESTTTTEYIRQPKWVLRG